MLIPRTTITIASFFTFALVIFASLPVTSLPVHAQVQQRTAVVPDDTSRGIKLYRQGDMLGAIEALRTAVKYHKDDPDAWLFLGLALARMSHEKEARKAFEKAVKLNPKSADARTGLAYTLLMSNKIREATREAEYALALEAKNAEAHYILGIARMKEREPSNALKEAEATLNIDPTFAPALLLKSQALIGVFVEKRFFVETSSASASNDLKAITAPLKGAAESLEKYLQLSPRAVDAALWREQLEALRPYAEDEDKPDAERRFFRSKEVTTKLRILSKPEPGYTEEARRNQITGTVILSAVFAGDSTVKHILVLAQMPYGLTEKAIAAARKIKFVPATKDGRPVSSVYRIEYNFNLY